MSSQPRFPEVAERTAPVTLVPAAGSGDVTEYSEDLSSLLGTLWRRRAVFLLGFLPTVLVAMTYLYFATPQYTATATLVLDPRKQVVINSPDVLEDLAPDSPLIDTQVQLMQSRTVIELAAQLLAAQPGGAVPHPAPRRLPSVLEPLQARVEAWLYTAEDEEEASTAPPEDAIAKLTDLIQQNLDVTRVDLTYAIRVNYTSDDPRFAAAVANAVADAYRRYQTELKLRATKDANSWLNKQVADLRERVEHAEAAVAEYRSRAGLLTMRGATLTESQLSNLDTSLSEAQQTLNTARATLDGYRTALQRDGAAEAAKIVATPAMQQFRSQYSDLSNQQAQLSSTLGPQHPQMLELKRRMEALRGEMNAEARRTIEQLVSDVAIAEKRVESIAASRDSSRQQLSQENASTVELGQLQANAQSLRNLYDDMLTRLQQTTAQASRSQVNANVVSEAVAPVKPTSPRSGMIMACALAMGTALGGLLIMLIQLLDRAVHDPKEFEKRVRLPVLALVPKLKRRDLRAHGKRIEMAHYVANKPLSLFAEAFRNLRVCVRRPRTDETVVVQVTSGTFGEGKTLCSIAFAQAAAKDGRRVLLIDADVRRRALTAALGIEARAGLVELLNGDAPLGDVLIPGVDGGTPHVIPLSNVDAGPHDRFAERPFRTLLQTLKHAYDLIIIDSAPVLAVAESLYLARNVDAVVMVARWTKTPVDTVIKARESIERAGGNIAGILLTHVDVKRVLRQTHGKRHYPELLRYYQR